MGNERGNDRRPRPLEDVAGRILGTALDVGWTLWNAGLEAADFAVRAVRATRDVILDAALPAAGSRPQAPNDGTPATGRPASQPTNPRSPITAAEGDRAVAVAPASGLDGEGAPGEEVETGAPAASGGTHAAGVHRGALPVTGANTGDTVAAPSGVDHDPFAPPLPEDRGPERMVALERDPDTIFAWWETKAPRAVERINGRLAPVSGAPGLGRTGPVLRVAVEDAPVLEMRLSEFATSAYIERPADGRALEITLGLAGDGCFVPVLGPVAVPARADATTPKGATRWRRVGDARATGSEPAPFPIPSREQALTLLGLATGRPATGSGDWPGQGPERRGPTGLPGS